MDSECKQSSEENSEVSETDHDQSTASAIKDGDEALARVRSQRAQLKARNYLAERNVFPLLSFLAGHILVEEPDDPLSFLYGVIARCIAFRDSAGPAPLLFNEPHLQSLCRALAGHHECLTEQQYHTGMSTLGITHYAQPEFDENNMITPTTFITAAQESLARMLYHTLQPKIQD